jgi:IS5 family transposase
LTTKIHAIVDALGNPVALSLTPGQSHDITQATLLLDQVEPDAFLADKGYDSDALVATLEARGITPVIPSKANRRVPRKTDFALYASAISSSGSSATSSNTEPFQLATTSSPILFLQRSRWSAYCSGSTDDTP